MRRAQSTSTLQRLAALLMYFVTVPHFVTVSADDSVPDHWIVPIAESPSSARSGRELAKAMASLSREDREQQMELLSKVVFE